jgi:apolipoprotein N-acyltransferase
VINWSVHYFALAFIGEGVLLALLAVVKPPGGLSASGLRWRGVTVGWLGCLLGLPWLTVLVTDDVASLALFALTPDVTVAATAVITLLWPRPVRWLVLAVPILWSLFSLLTLGALGLYWLVPGPVFALGVALPALVLRR